MQKSALNQHLKSDQLSQNQNIEIKYISQTIIITSVNQYSNITLTSHTIIISYFEMIYNLVEKIFTLVKKKGICRSKSRRRQRGLVAQIKPLDGPNDYLSS